MLLIAYSYDSYMTNTLGCQLNLYVYINTLSVKCGMAKKNCFNN